MKKITTLYKKSPHNLARVSEEIDPQNSWVFEDEGVRATRKFDGTACAIINGYFYKRYDVKKGKQVPEGAIPCQEPDLITGHWPHWVRCETDNPADKYHWEAWKQYTYSDGTYELIGEKIQGNPEKIEGHKLVRHGEQELLGLILPLTFDNIKNYLEIVNIEGIVFHHPDGRMCKIRKSDFGIKR